MLLQLHSYTYNLKYSCIYMWSMCLCMHKYAAYAYVIVNVSICIFPSLPIFHA
ncbi:hypothetical protein HanXRQr2_Chr02g0050791 [Helianthus annuus]|uniref:Uncharacterized protein n=1 Tax=Helianthus annuus TaxID=4232 RepID=A0A9K3JKG0_HELAN|nr:hypothetical protein HanXRQr2_Chr02g0050791 [Helianthus annuus]